MTHEERKAIAKQEYPICSRQYESIDKNYPDCCEFHEGFDAAFSLLEKSVTNSSYPTYVVGPVDQ